MNTKENNSISLGGLNNNEKYIVSVIRDDPKSSFIMIGNGHRNTKLNKEIDVMDVIVEMSEMTAQELFLIAEVKKNLTTNKEKRTSKTGNVYYVDYNTNTSFIESKKYTSAEKQKIKTGYKRLNEKNILRRVKREYYIVNPSFFIPRYQEQTIKDWNNAH